MCAQFQTGSSSVFAEAQVGDVHHRLLAEEVVDPVDLRLVEDLEELVVQLASAGEVVAERLLDHDPAAVGEPRVVEAVDDAGEERRRDLQVEDRVAGALQGLAHSPIRARVGVVARRSASGPRAGR